MKRLFISILILSLLVTNFFIKSISAASYVAELIVYSTVSDTHSFILVKNLTGKNLKVGHYTIKGKNSLSLGTWGTIKQHSGLWYNIEISNYVYIPKHYSVSRKLTSANIKKVSSEVNKSDVWKITNNCSSFARKIWNSSGGKKLSASNGLIDTPSDLAKSIKKNYKSSYKTNRKIPNSKSNTVYYHSKKSMVKCVPKFKKGGNSSYSL